MCLFTDKQPDVISSAVLLVKDDETDGSRSTGSTKSKSEAPMQVIPGVRAHLSANHLDSSTKRVHLPRYGVESSDMAALDEVCI
jgi:hypothetical protein